MKIKRDILDKIIAHAQKEAPLEACGYLAGKDGIIVKHYELTNTDKSEEHFSFDPKEQFETLRDARQNGLEMSAVYHSHPATPARPSEEDKRLAYDPNIRYVIISLADGMADVRSFRIVNSAVTPEYIETVE
jgi:proteasome lid subunit RPN8/RPN11